MAIDPLLTRYRAHLAEAEFHEAARCWICSSNAGLTKPWAEIIATERERLEQAALPRHLVAAARRPPTSSSGGHPSRTLA